MLFPEVCLDERIHEEQQMDSQTSQLTALGYELLLTS